jgi:hypothetical protein
MNETFLTELRDALLGSDVISYPTMWVTPMPIEADRIVEVVRKMFEHSDWQVLPKQSGEV